MSATGLRAAPNDPEDLRARRLADTLSTVFADLERLDRFMGQLRDVRAGRLPRARAGSNYSDVKVEPDGALLYHEVLDVCLDDGVDEETLGVPFTFDELESGLRWWREKIIEWHLGPDAPVKTVLPPPTWVDRVRQRYQRFIRGV